MLEKLATEMPSTVTNREGAPSVELLSMMAFDRLRLLLPRVPSVQDRKGGESVVHHCAEQRMTHSPHYSP